MRCTQTMTFYKRERECDKIMVCKELGTYNLYSSTSPACTDDALNVSIFESNPTLIFMSCE